MAKKKSPIKMLDFDIFLNSITISKIKELIKFYNQTILTEDKREQKLKGYSTLRKLDLISLVNTSLNNKDKQMLYKKFEEDFVENLSIMALSLISGEHKLEKIQNAIVIANGKGYNVWFSGKYGSEKASLQINNNVVERECNCKIGKNKGLCQHQMAIYLMLIGKNIIKPNQLPFSISKELMNDIQKRLNLVAAQSLFKEDPAIMLEGDYKIYINGELVTLDWGGDYAGKSTKDISKEKLDVETWVTTKVVDLIIKRIRVKTGIGQPIKILLDNYGVIPKILNNSKLIDKILKRFSVLNDSTLPTNKDELENYLKSNLKMFSTDINIEPPFSAYMGDTPYIFVSYPHKDKAEVYPIIQKLNNKGFKIWYDEGIPLSSDWCNTIAEKLLESKLFLSFISPSVIDSENTQDEIHLALNEKKPYLAIYLKETELNPGLKMRIRRVQGILKYEMDEKRFYDRLITDLEKLFQV
jgi:hypothetical protein